jgi:uncharacterized protein YgbK (DUF1537 family)
MRLAILADDLTGALDAAAPFAHDRHWVEVWFGEPAKWPRPDYWMHVVAATTESRLEWAPVAAQRTAAFADTLRVLGAPRLFKKIDSTLRGPWVEELEATRAALGDPPVVLCPAFPEQRRVVRDGVLYAGGERVGDVIEMLCGRMMPRRGRILHLPRATQPEFGSLFRDAVEEGAVIVCDAETPADLRALAQQACADRLATSPGLSKPWEAHFTRSYRLLLCGAAGLARAVAGVTERWPGAYRPRGPLSAAIRPVVIVGSCHPMARRQLRQLCAAEDPVEILATPDPHPEVPEDPRRVRALADELLAQCTVAPFDAFVLTGGETAAAVLRVLRVTRLEVLRELEPGVVLSEMMDGYCPGALCITKAGGFGDEETLVRIANWIPGGTADDAE